MISPALATLAAPVAQAATTASQAALRGVQGAFDLLLRDDPEPEAVAEGEKGGVPETNSAVELQKQADALLEDFREQAMARLAAAGITLDAPLVLEADRLGGVRVVGGHPQAGAIERILSEDPQLVKTFEAWQGTHRAADRQRRAEQWERLYALDPTAAQAQDAQFSSLDEPPLRVTLASV